MCKMSGPADLGALGLLERREVELERQDGVSDVTAAGHDDGTEVVGGERHALVRGDARQDLAQVGWTGDKHRDGTT